jgi:hypothetical protein
MTWGRTLTRRCRHLYHHILADFADFSREWDSLRP